ncbi:transglutaminase TgpA family protein [Candidatus Poriferisodalis sp.]|uniref:transglutaminase TgpA family protein n=1 Tax=Candidatus Poriferisodalis sp. TaxID=3101277 RepID=UPI003B023B6D
MSRRSLWQVEITLWLLTLLTVLGARRLFDAWDYLPLWLMAALGGHASAALTRRQRWPVAVAAAASALTLVLVEGLALYPSTLWLRLLPSTETFRQASADVTAAWDAFGIVEAPTPAAAGFLLVGGAVVWIAAFTADALALRTGSAGLALVPAFAMFAFVAALGTDAWGIRSAAAMVLCTVAFVAAHGVHHSADRTRVGSLNRRRATVPMRTALRLGTAAAVCAALTVPLLPGSDAPAIVSWKDLDGTVPAARVTISPLVNAQGRLVGSSGAELFRVRADAPAYWRVSGLSRFDGRFWGSEQTYRSAARHLLATADDELLNQQFTIGALDSVWLPAAYEPRAYDGPDALYDPETGTLVTEHSSELAPAMTYSVSSKIDIPSVVELMAAGGDVPADVSEQYLALPDGFSPRVADLAADLAADAVGPYAQALALQNFFLDNFVYALSVPGGHDADRMEQFLFDERRGYCEQFAGTYAAMARSIGLPARVAVGFTPGELIDGEYVVRGEHYHAWPEVWIAGRWVYFEPTPGRGAPGAVTYTGVAAQQAVSGDPDAAGESGSGFIGALGLEDLEGLSADLEGFVDVFDAEGSQAPAGQWSEWLVVPFYAALAVGVLWLVTVYSAVRVRRVLHHRRARSDTRAGVGAAWGDVAETLFDVGIDRRAAETHAEFAQRAGRRLRIDSGELRELAHVAQAAVYSAEPPTQAAVAQAKTDARRLESRIRSLRSRWDRLRTACGTAALVAGPRSRRRHRSAGYGWSSDSPRG